MPRVLVDGPPLRAVSIEMKRFESRGSTVAYAVVFALAALLAAGGLLLMAKELYDSASTQNSAFREKLGELVLQLALIVIVGALLAALFKAAVNWITAQGIRQREKADRQMDLLRRVRAMHVAIENSRSLMKAHRMNAQRGATTYREQSRRLMELRPEVEEVSQELAASPSLFSNQQSIREGLAGIIAYGENEYIDKNADVDADVNSAETFQDSIDQLDMHWVKDFVNQGSQYREKYDKNLDRSKGAMRQQVYGS